MLNGINRKIFLVVGIFIFLSGAGMAKAANIGDIVNFNVDKNFDASGRTQIPATLVSIGNRAYFYVEKALVGFAGPV